MDVDATVINATAGGGQHSEAKKAELMRNNSCFYCEKPGHRASNCRKKQADRGQSSGHFKSAQTGVICETPDFQNPDSISKFLKDNMDSLDEDTKLSIIERLVPKDFTEAQN